jgi:hypothetical protein
MQETSSGNLDERATMSPEARRKAEAELDAKVEKHQLVIIVTKLLELEPNEKIGADELRGKVTEKIKCIETDTYLKFKDEFLYALTPSIFVAAAVNVAIIILCTALIKHFGAWVMSGVAIAGVLDVIGYKIATKIFEKKYKPIEEILRSGKNPMPDWTFNSLDLSPTVSELLRNNHFLQRFEELIPANDEQVASLLQTKRPDDEEYRLLYPNPPRLKDNDGEPKARLSTNLDPDDILLLSFKVGL